MPEIIMSLRPKEYDWLVQHARKANVTPQALLRAMLAYTAAAKARGGRIPVYKEVVRMAQEGLTLPDVSPMSTVKATSGQQKGYTGEDYRKAYQQAGSISGAARLLGVHRKTVQEMLDALGER